MLKWERLCMPKGMGGLWFRDMRLFNLALLGRQVWRLINAKDTPCYQVLSSKYFPDGSIFNAKNMDKPSFAWNSIQAAAMELKDGFGWQIGDGSKVNTRKDRWSFEGLNGKSIGNLAYMNSLSTMHYLWLPRARAWDRARVQGLYGESLGDRICEIPISCMDMSDCVIWFHANNGCYSTKAGYTCLIIRRVGMGPHRFLWKIIWKLRLPPLRFAHSLGG